MRRIFAGIIVVGMACTTSALLSDKCNQETWVTNGPVNAILPYGDKIYIGGSFHSMETGFQSSLFRTVQHAGNHIGEGIPLSSMRWEAPAIARHSEQHVS